MISLPLATFRGLCFACERDQEVWILLSTPHVVQCESPGPFPAHSCLNWVFFGGGDVSGAPGALSLIKELRSDSCVAAATVGSKTNREHLPWVGDDTRFGWGEVGETEKQSPPPCR